MSCNETRLGENDERFSTNRPVQRSGPAATMGSIRAFDSRLSKIGRQSEYQLFSIRREQILRDN